MPHLHKCYFHKQNNITHFCSKLQCTLPMCDECLPIHLQEHANPKQDEGIIPIHEAEQQAIRSLKNYINNESKLRTECFSKVEEVKSQIMRSVNQYFADIRSKTDTQFIGMGQVEKKLAKIQKGSLKALIYFYSQQKQKEHQLYANQLMKNLLEIEKQLKKVLRGQYEGKKIIQYLQAVDIKPKQFVQQSANINEVTGLARERGYSFDTHNEQLRKQVQMKSVTDLKVVNGTNQNSTMNYELSRKLNIDRSLKVMPNPHNIYEPREFERKITQRQNSCEEGNRYSMEKRIQIDNYRHKQIQMIRAREEQRELQRKKREDQLKDQQRKLQLQKERELERQKQEERERERQRQRQKERQRERQMDSQKTRIRQLQYERHKLKLSEQDNDRSKNELGTYEDRSWKYQAMSRNETNAYKEMKTNIYRQQDINKRPLQVTDLNIESNTKQTSGSKITKSYNFNKQNEDKTPLCQNLFELNKEVLSPKEIRRMLEKRIEERSRLISKSKIENRGATPPKPTENAPYRVVVSKTKQYSQNQYGMQNEDRWDTKDSIINQIYQDYRN